MKIVFTIIAIILLTITPINAMIFERDEKDEIAFMTVFGWIWSIVCVIYLGFN